jgi:hypothetical protein
VSEVEVWSGHIVELDGDTVCASMTRHGDPLYREFYAEFSRADVRRAGPLELGDYLTLFVPAGARREDCLLAQIVLPPWTEAELIEIRRRAAEMAEHWALLSD